MEGEKKTRGKQKIEMKKIENLEDRLITFSKRRSGIYKKTSELVTLCGAQAGVLVFSPSGRPFSYGHPSFGDVARRFLYQQVKQNPDTITMSTADQARGNAKIDELNHLHNDLMEELESAKERGKALKQGASVVGTKGKEKEGEGDCEEWWRSPVNALGVEELEKLFESFRELHMNLYEIGMKKKTEGSSSLISPTVINHNDNNTNNNNNNNDNNNNNNNSEEVYYPILDFKKYDDINNTNNNNNNNNNSEEVYFPIFYFEMDEEAGAGEG